MRTVMLLLMLGCAACSSSATGSPAGGADAASDAGARADTATGDDTHADTGAPGVDAGHETDAIAPDAGELDADAGPPPTATVTGAFGTTTITAWGSAGRATRLTQHEDGVHVDIFDVPATCAMEAASLYPAGSRALSIEIQDTLTDGGVAQLQPGTYPLAQSSGGSGITASIAFQERSASCGYTLIALADGVKDGDGTLTIASISSTSVTGSFSIHWSSGKGTMTGTFEAPLCDGGDAGAGACH